MPIYKSCILAFQEMSAPISVRPRLRSKNVVSSQQLFLTAHSPSERQSSNIKSIDNQSIQGIAITLGIFGAWAVSLVWLLSLDVSQLQPLWLIPVIACRAFLYTGLFIVAHDAMHRSLFPQNYKINDLLGSVAVFIYACFSYQKLLKNHWLHHRFPASERDPDFHSGQSQNFFLWYLRFMQKYWSWTQLLKLIVIYYGAQFLFHVPEINLVLFWVVPALLSSLQLFYFGTFLPHREPEGGHAHPHRARSTSLPPFLSFITCYHFGYHEEHHEYPQVCWWQLPAIRKARMNEDKLPAQ
jgi:beta-carotene ketolase (CrtW type)